MKDIKPSQLLSLISNAMIVSAVLWWLHDYGEFITGGHVDIEGAINLVACTHIYNMSCGMLVEFGYVMGALSYNPLLMWIGMGVGLVGIYISGYEKDDDK